MRCMSLCLESALPVPAWAWPISAKAAAASSALTWFCTLSGGISTTRITLPWAPGESCRGLSVGSAPLSNRAGLTLLFQTS
ncbi:hypothetical protein D3C81_1826960 [compost metagenome]